MLSAGIAQAASVTKNSNSWMELGKLYNIDPVTNVLFEDNHIELGEKVVAAKNEKMGEIQQKINEIMNNNAKAAEESKKSGNKKFVPQIMANEVPVLNEDAIVKDVENSIITIFLKLDKTNLEILPTNVREVNLKNKTLTFQTFSLNGKTYIQKKIPGNSPVVHYSRNGNRFVFEDENNLFEIDPISLAVSQLTKNDFNGIPKEAYFQKYQHVYWSANPQISPNGDKLIYYSNKSNNGGEPALENGLWLHAFDQGQTTVTDSVYSKEKRIVKDSDLANGAFLNPNVQWLDNDTIIYETVVPNQAYQFIKYNIASGEQEIIYNHSTDALAWDKGYIVTRERNLIHVINASNGEIVTYDLVRQEKENMIAISNSGVVALPNNGKIAVLNPLDRSVHFFNIPQTHTNYMIQQWVDNDQLLVTIENNSEMKSSILNVGGKQ